MDVGLRHFCLENMDKGFLEEKIKESNLSFKFEIVSKEKRELLIIPIFLKLKNEYFELGKIDYEKEKFSLEEKQEIEKKWIETSKEQIEIEKYIFSERWVIKEIVDKIKNLFENDKLFKKEMIEKDENAENSYKIEHDGVMIKIKHLKETYGYSLVVNSILVKMKWGQQIEIVSEDIILPKTFLDLPKIRLKKFFI